MWKKPLFIAYKELTTSNKDTEMSLIQFCPNTSLQLPFSFFPLGSFVALSFSVDSLSQTISLLQLSLTIVPCTTETKAFLVHVCCAVSLPILEKLSPCAAVAKKNITLGTSVFMGKGTGDYPASPSLRAQYDFGVETRQEIQSNDFPSAHLPGAVLGSLLLVLQPWGAVQAQGHLRLDPGVLEKQQCPRYKLHFPGCPRAVNKWDSSCVECV